MILFYLSIRVKNIYVIGNKLVREQEIIDLAELTDYPLINRVNEDKIKSNILKNSLIDEVNVKKNLLGSVTIVVKESRVLYQNNENEYVLSNGKKISQFDQIVPILINECEKEDKLIKKMNLINESILIRISEIEYTPTDLDKEKFLFYMIDGNYVYVTLSKIELINSYNEIYPSLDGKKGILHLDSGNHFEIKE